MMLLSAGCGQDILRALNSKTDQFKQNSAAMVDILWIVDNSRSMGEEQTGLGSSFQVFADNLVSSGVDFHIGVISTDVADGGALHFGSGMPSFIDPSTTDPQGTFLQNVAIGTGGSPQEKGFETAALALGKGAGWQPCTPTNQPPSCDSDPVVTPNPGFLRRGYCDPFNTQSAADKTCEGTSTSCSSDDDCDDAAMFLIFVSDEDDKSFGPVRYYWRLFESYKGPGNEARIKIAGIVGPVGAAGSSDPDGCFNAARGSAQAGYRYVDLVKQSAGADEGQGIITSICEEFVTTPPDPPGPLQILSITAAGLSSRFELSSLPNQNASISCPPIEGLPFCVEINGSPVPRNPSFGWQYDRNGGNNGAIVFGASGLPKPQSNITVTYQALPGT